MEGAEEALESEREAREAAELTAHRMQRLATVATALSSAATALEVAEVITEEAKLAIGADAGGVWLLDGSHTKLVMLAAPGVPDALKDRIGTYPLDAENPLCLAVRLGEPVWVQSWEEYATQFPASEARIRGAPEPKPQAFGCLPLRIEAETIGGLAFTFFHPHEFSAGDRAFIALLAQSCAQGMDRARLYERALEAIRARDDFLTIAGHELRTPLGALVLQTELMVSAPTDAAARERCGPIMRMVRRLARLADDFLDVTRIRAGRLNLEPQWMELSTLVREVATATAATVARPPPPLTIHATETIEGQWDPLRIEQVVTNLVGNACKYGAGTPVEVRVERAPGGARIVVRDHGIGITAADQARIFERFARAVAPGEFSGLGLGLWIVREIVDGHGGKITVRSEPGHGAEFTVTLPLAPPAKQGAP